MSEKHKSKYKKPENTKYKSRTDLKDYTMDDKDGKLNPYSTKQKLSNVLRKTDKTVQDDGNYDVKYNADDRLYKDLDDAEYDAKHAAKVFKKRQDAEEKDFLDIKDKVENLTREQRERLVREYVRRTIVKQLIEQEEKDEEDTPPAAETPDAPAAGGAPAPEAGVTPDAGAVTGGAPPAPLGGTPPAATGEPAPTDTQQPATDTEKETETPEDKAKEKIAKQKVALKYWEETLADQSGPNALVDIGFDAFGKALSNLGKDDLRMAKILILRRLAKIKPAAASNTEETK
jgi:hypothetical protein